MIQKYAPRAGVAEELRHGRRYHRNFVNQTARVEIHATGGGRFTQGTAVIRDISLQGARLGDLRLEGRFLPSAPFLIHLDLPPTMLPGLRAVCRPVRIACHVELELGVVFEEFLSVAGNRPPRR